MYAKVAGVSWTTSCVSSVMDLPDPRSHPGCQWPVCGSSATPSLGGFPRYHTARPAHPP
jgi:hypothetical protein